MGDYEEKFLYTIILGCVLIIIITFLVLKSVLFYRYRYIGLQRECVKVEVASIDAERRRISKELHDGVGAYISILRLNIREFERMYKDSKIPQLLYINLDYILKNIRQISENLTPSVLDKNGLSDAIRVFSKEINMQNGELYVEFESINYSRQSGFIETNMYRITQEVINNAIKHSKGSVLQIKLVQTSKVLTLVYKDNGVGYDFDRMRLKKGHHGLRNIESRIEMMKGRVITSGYDNTGTGYIVQIPLTKELLDEKELAEELRNKFHLKLDLTPSQVLEG